jgi:hypothetical protein
LVSDIKAGTYIEGVRENDAEEMMMLSDNESEGGSDFGSPTL